MKKLPSLSAFFPCYNERDSVSHMVLTLEQVLPQVARTYEIIIVDDGSMDGTLEEAKRIARENTHVTVVRHERNKGYGAALKSGFKASTMEWTFFTDGDLQFDINQLKSFIPHTAKYDVVIGYRKRRAEGWRRSLNARLFKLYIDLLFRLHVKDIDCAFKLFRTRSIQELPLLSDGACISAEFLYRLKKKRYRFKQLPVTHLPRQYGTPTGSNINVILKAGVESLRLYLTMKRDQLASGGRTS